MSDKKHVLIVGGGIAGLSLAFYCIKNNISFKLLDSGINVSSKVAAGLVNPIVFRRMTKSWNADIFLPAAVSFYEEIGELLGKIYFHEIPIRRAFAHEQELDLWKKREEQEAYVGLERSLGGVRERSHTEPPPQTFDSPLSLLSSPSSTHKPHQPHVAGVHERVWRSGCIGGGAGV